MKDKKSGPQKPEESQPSPPVERPKPEMKANPKLIGRSIFMSGAPKGS